MRRKIILIAFVLLCLTSCSQKEEIILNDVIIASWNVENLFNGQDDGNEYSEYQSSNGWTDSQYRVRLKKIDTVLNYDNLKGARIIVLNEVENESVVEDILSLTALKKRGFCYYACCGEETGAIKTAVISSLPITEANVHSITGQRPVLEVNINAGGTNICILAVHGKSNLGDQDSDVEQRIATGNLVEKTIQQIKAEKPSSTIILAGDFNEDAEDTHIVQSQSSWDNFWDRTNNLNANGSYLYQEEWKKYDNILVLKNGLWKQVDGNVEFTGILMNVDHEINSWKRYLLSGVSDHLPVWIKMER